MPGAGATKGEQVAAWFEDAVHLIPDVLVVGNAAGIPALAHEAQFVRWICHDGVHAAGRQVSHDRAAIPVVQRH